MRRMPRLLAGESMVLPPIRKHWLLLVPRAVLARLLAVAQARGRDPRPLGSTAASAVALTLIGLGPPAGDRLVLVGHVARRHPDR